MIANAEMRSLEDTIGSVSRWLDQNGYQRERIDLTRAFSPDRRPVPKSMLVVLLAELRLLAFDHGARISAFDR